MAVRVVAVDWSGAARNAHRKICLAEVADRELVRLEPGLRREQIADYLTGEAKRDVQMVVGLDFAFSFPEWFSRQQGASTVREVWALAEREAENWLKSCEPPFWGRRGKPKPELREPEHYRQTELEARRVGGFQPKSVFQIAGAGTVGAGSLRGMPLLGRLSDEGFYVWPFDPPGWPRVVEIYPRLLTGPVNKTSSADRESHLARYPDIDKQKRSLAISSGDAFDAAISALVMADHLDQLASLAPDPALALEGAVWYPRASLSRDAA